MDTAECESAESSQDLHSEITSEAVDLSGHPLIHTSKDLNEVPPSQFSLFSGKESITSSAPQRAVRRSVQPTLHLSEEVSVAHWWNYVSFSCVNVEILIVFVYVEWV